MLDGKQIGIFLAVYNTVMRGRTTLYLCTVIVHSLRTDVAKSEFLYTSCLPFRRLLPDE